MSIEDSLQDIRDRLIRIERRLDMRTVSGGATQEQMVLGLLRARPDRFMSVREMAGLIGISRAAVRMVVYTHQAELEKKKQSPRKVLWKFKEARNAN